MSIEKYNYRKRIYDYQIPENEFKGYAKLSDYSIGSVLPVFGFFISHSGRFGESPIAIMKDRYLNLPKHRIEIIEKISQDDEAVADINAGKVALRVITYDKNGKTYYDFEFVDISADDPDLPF